MLKSMKTGVLGLWLVKASVWKDTICVVLFNRESHETYTNFFKSQSDAHDFIQRVVFAVE